MSDHYVPSMHANFTPADADTLATLASPPIITRRRNAHRTLTIRRQR